MTKLRSKGLTGAVLVAVLMAGSLRGLEAGADSAVVWETRSAAELSVIEGQGWWGGVVCGLCIGGSVVGAIVSGGSAAIAFLGCAAICYVIHDDEA